MINRLLKWLDASTCNVLAIDTVTRALKDAKFSPLSLADDWGDLKPGTRHYVTVNSTALFAFIVGEKNPAEAGFHIIASHSDSPCFKLKPNPEMYCEGGLVKLDVEKYGGGIMYTWFDRPLSLSGRVALRTDDPLNPRMVAVDLKHPICTIPHLAIHFNRAVNEGNPLSVQRDMLPVLGIFPDAKPGTPLVKQMVAEALGVEATEILDSELCLYPVESASLVGANSEFFQSGRIDDLSMAFASLQALLDTADTSVAATRCMAIFDNEETGSGTKQGAGSPALAETLLRLCGGKPADLSRGVARSFMISADDAHAWHPNYGPKFDPQNHALMGQGPAIKINANCKYMTDAQSAAVFRSLCEKAGVNCQYFVNHSDVAGGSTLGNILTGQLPLKGVDMGAPIWAMHSARETASVADHVATVKVFETFFKQ